MSFAEVFGACRVMMGLGDWQLYASAFGLFMVIPGSLAFVGLGAPLWVATFYGIGGLLSLIGPWTVFRAARTIYHTPEMQGAMRRELSEHGIRISGNETRLIHWTGCESCHIGVRQALVFLDPYSFVSFRRAALSAEDWTLLSLILRQRLPPRSAPSRTEAAAAIRREQDLQTIAKQAAAVQLEAAVALCDEALARDEPRHRQASFYALRGAARVDLEAFAAGEEDLTQALTFVATGRWHWARGLARFFLGRRDEAGVDFHHAVDLSPTNGMYLASLAHWHADGGDSSSANRYVEMARRVDPDCSSRLAGLASGLAARGARVLGRHVVECALLLDSHNVTALGMRARWRADSGELALAQADFDAAIASDPRDAGSYIDRCAFFSQQENWLAALADAEAALAIEPSHEIAVSNRIGVLLRLGRDALALGEAEAFVARSPQTFRAHMQLAGICALARDVRLRDPVRALSAATRACELADWDRWNVLSMYATGLAANERFDEASQWLERAIARPDFPAAGQKEARDRLDCYRARRPWELPKQDPSETSAADFTPDDVPAPPAPRA